MMEKQNRFEKQAVGDADMTDDVVAAAVAGMEKTRGVPQNGKPGYRRSPDGRKGLAD